MKYFLNDCLKIFKIYTCKLKGILLKNLLILYLYNKKMYKNDFTFWIFLKISLLDPNYKDILYSNKIISNKQLLILTNIFTYIIYTYIYIYTYIILYIDICRYLFLTIIQYDIIEIDPFKYFILYIFSNIYI